MINDNQTKLSKLGFASDWIHAAERSKKTPTISEVLRRRSPFRSLQPSPLRQMLTQRCRTIAVHRRWCWSMRAPTTFVGDGRMNFLVTSFWLERTSCRFRVRLRRSQYFSNTNTFHIDIYHNFLLKACFKSLQVQLILLLAASLRVYWWIWWWKSFEYRSPFGQVMGNLVPGRFFIKHGVYIQSPSVSAYFIPNLVPNPCSTVQPLCDLFT